MDTHWRLEHTLLIILISIFVVGYAWWPFLLRTDDPFTNIYTWLIIAILLTAFVLVLGWGITGKLLGVLINEHYRISLSRFQIVLWTILILSAWIAAVTWNLAIGDATPLGIDIPPQVWALLGISVTSLVGTPIILSAKTKKTPAVEEQVASLRRIGPQENPTVANAAYRNNLAQIASDVRNAPTTATANGAAAAANVAMGAPVGAAPTTVADVRAQVATNVQEVAANVGIRFKGLAVSRTDPSDAKISDMFTGDEVGTASLVDVGKVQMFIFTLIIALAYASSIGEILVTAIKDGVGTEITMFPALDPSMVTLLGISHVGYLGFKAAPHTETEETKQV